MAVNTLGPRSLAISKKELLEHKDSVSTPKRGEKMKIPVLFAELPPELKIFGEVSKCFDFWAFHSVQACGVLDCRALGVE